MSTSQLEGATIVKPVGGRIRLLSASTAARIAVVVLILGSWQLSAGTFVNERFSSKPSSIAQRLWDWFSTGFVLPHIRVTMTGALVGFALGSAVAIMLALLLGTIRFLGDVLAPFLAAFYTLPKYALGPLFILWLGIGLEMRIYFVSLSTFFVVYWNTFAAVRTEDPELVDILRLMHANPWQRLVKFTLPNSWRGMFSGLKVAAPLALVSAVVAELIASDSGLGFLLKRASAQTDVTGTMSVLVILMVIGIVINEGLDRSENFLLRWKSAGVMK